MRASSRAGLDEVAEANTRGALPPRPGGRAGDLASSRAASPTRTRPRTSTRWRGAGRTRGALVLVRPGSPGASSAASGGREENVASAQRAYYHRARMNGAARTGTYTAALETEADGGPGS